MSKTASVNFTQVPYRPIDGIVENPFLQFIPVVGTLLSYKRIHDIERQFNGFQAAYRTKLGATTMAEDRVVTLIDTENALVSDPQESVHQIPLKERLTFLTALENKFKDAVDQSKGGWAVRFVAWIVCAIVLCPFLWIGFVLDCVLLHCYLLEEKTNIEEIEEEISSAIAKVRDAIKQKESSGRDPFDTPFFREHCPQLIGTPRFGRQTE